MTTEVRLHSGASRRLRGGHLWVFANELATPVKDLVPGGAVRVLEADGRPLGVGYANPASLIAIRLLSHDPDADIDSVELYRDRLRDALAYRAIALPGRASLRLVAGEADGLPGLIVDRYQDPDTRKVVLAVQVTTLGLEQRRPLLREALTDLLSPDGVARCDTLSARRLEGLEERREIWWGEVPELVPFKENGVRLLADPLAGQKTGHFFDQADNRAFAFSLAGGRRVLDVYSHTGAWAVGAMVHGAAAAVAIDSSARALATLQSSAAKNAVTVATLDGDARARMEELTRQGERFDLVFLDPPAFAKSRRHAAGALKAYRDQNRMAMALVAPGGLLFTSSCSHHILEDRFQEEVVEAARRAGRSLRLVRRGQQAPDHPVHPGIPESRYLKHLVLQVR